MRFSDSFLDEIRTRLPASEVVGRRVKLKKQGREFAGLSPFNAEKTASFFVNDQKGKWFDFSAGRTGDIFSFVMETEGLSFPEAVERLAGEAGVQMPARDPNSEAREKERASLHEVMELAAAFFETSLNSAAGAGARGYLLRRDIGPEAQRRFRIGYAPSGRSELKADLAAKGVDQTLMEAAGLLVTGDDIPVSFDRFRDRVMFPITDLRDRVVGFGGRAMSAEVQAKYLNSPETDLFHKGALVYNGSVARKAAHDEGTVIVVEGYADVVQMASAGFANTVAPLGTALTERQLALLWRMADEPILCFDGDPAGVRAANRAVDLALPLLEPGKSLRFAVLPAGQDPDDLVRAEGRAAVEAVIAAARTMIDVLWARETEHAAFDTPERRAALEAELGRLARSIGDETVRRHYLRLLRERAEVFFGYGDQRRDGERFGGGHRGPARFGGPSSRDRRPTRPDRLPVSERLKRSTLIRGTAANPLREAVLIMTMVNHPALIADDVDEFSSVEFSHRELDRLREAALGFAAEIESIDADRMRAHLDTGPHRDLVARLERQIREVGLWSAGPAADDADAAEMWRQVLVLYRRERTLHRELRDAETALAGDPSDINLARLVDIQNQLASPEGTEALIDGFGAGSGRESPAF